MRQVIIALFLSLSVMSPITLPTPASAQTVEGAQAVVKWRVGFDALFFESFDVLNRLDAADLIVADFEAGKITGPNAIQQLNELSLNIGEAVVRQVEALRAYPDLDDAMIAAAPALRGLKPDAIEVIEELQELIPDITAQYISFVEGDAKSQEKLIIAQLRQFKTVLALENSMIESIVNLTPDQKTVAIALSQCSITTNQVIIGFLESEIAFLLNQDPSSHFDQMQKATNAMAKHIENGRQYNETIQRQLGPALLIIRKNNPELAANVPKAYALFYDNFDIEEQLLAEFVSLTEWAKSLGANTIDEPDRLERLARYEVLVAERIDTNQRRLVLLQSN